MTAEELLKRTEMVMEGFRGLTIEECLRVYMASIALLGLSKSKGASLIDFSSITGGRKKSEEDPSGGTKKH